MTLPNSQFAELATTTAERININRFGRLADALNQRIPIARVNVTDVPVGVAEGDVLLVAATGATGALTGFDGQAALLLDSGWTSLGNEYLWHTTSGDYAIATPGANWTQVVGGAAAITVSDEGTALTGAPVSMNFMGAGVTTTSTVGGAVTVLIPGTDAAALAIADEGINLTTTATSIDFVGAGVTASNIGGAVTVTIPGGSAGGRTLLTAPTTYYVRTDGNDGNTGLANTPTEAFLTPTRARNQVRQIDGNGFDVTIQFSDGTYVLGNGATWSGFTGIPNITLRGNIASPSSVVLQGDITGLTLSGNTTNFLIEGFTAQGIVENCINILGGASVTTGVMRYAPRTAGLGIAASGGSSLSITNNFSIVGGTYFDFFNLQGYSFVSMFSTLTITHESATTYTNRFVNAFGAFFSYIPNNITLVGGVTGSRGLASYNGVINRFGQPENLPGSSASIVSTGGVSA